MKALDEITKKHLISKLSGVASKANAYSFEFAVLLYEETKDIDWKQSGGKMNFFEELTKDTGIHIKDAGCIRQINVAGQFIYEHYKEDVERLSTMYYWTFHNIARARLSRDDERNIQKKKELVEEVLSGETPEGKVKARINEIKDRDQPKELAQHLSYFNQWSFGRLDRAFGIPHPGQIPGQILVNIIYHYLPFDASIIDPMSGGGTTYDVCEYMNGLEVPESLQPNLFTTEVQREYDLSCTCFDLAPRRDFIIKKNALEDDWNIENADLVFLDPPYFTMMKDDYVENDFTRDRKSFFNAIDTIVKKAHGALKPGGMVALIIQPQTEKDLEEDEVCLDLPFECYKIMEKYFKPYNRIQTPLSTSQFNNTDMSRVAKFENRRTLLGTARDLILMKK